MQVNGLFAIRFVAWLYGLFASEFNSLKQAAFHAGIAGASSGLKSSQVIITSFADVAVERSRRYSSQEAGASISPKLEVAFEIIGLEAEEAASKVSKDIEEAAKLPTHDTRSLAYHLHDTGVTTTFLQLVKQPEVIQMMIIEETSVSNITFGNSTRGASARTGVLFIVIGNSTDPSILCMHPTSETTLDLRS